MNFWFKGHHHKTAIRVGVKTRLSKWFGSYKWPVTTWLQHQEDCCNYWLSVDSPEGRRALMLDDELRLTPPKTDYANNYLKK